MAASGTVLRAAITAQKACGALFAALSRQAAESAHSFNSCKRLPQAVLHLHLRFHAMTRHSGDLPCPWDQVCFLPVT